MNNHLKIILIFVLLSIVNNGLLGQSNPAMNQLIRNAVAAQKLMDPAPQKFNQAKTLEKAGLTDQALTVYIELNQEYPGVSRYFKPLRSILIQKKDWASLENFSLLYGEANPNDIYAIVDLGEVYLLWEKPEKWMTVFDSILQNHPENSNAVKMVVNRLISSGNSDYGKNYLNKYRKLIDDPYFYSLEMGSFYSVRMAYKDAMQSYLLYLEGNPANFAIVRDRVLAFPEDEFINEIILRELEQSKLPTAKFILADVKFKNRQFRLSYSLLINNNADEKMLLNFGSDLRLAGEYDLADSILNNILITSRDEAVLQDAIFAIAQVYETRTLQSLYLLPLSGFFRGNPIFSSPYLRVDENQAATLYQAVAIYDSLKNTVNSIEAAYRLAEIKYRVLNDLDGAFEYYTELIESKSNHPYRLDCFLRKMDIYITRGDLDLAEQEIIQNLKNTNRLRVNGRDETTELKMKLAQIYFYHNQSADLDSLLTLLIDKVQPANDKLNDILELASVTISLKNSPEVLEEYSDIQLKIHQGKRSEAIESLTELCAGEDQILVGMMRYQLAHLLLLQGKVPEAQETALTIPAESSFAVYGLILWSEIEDRINHHPSTAIDGYLEFLETYPNSIYYDDIRLRLRELAS